MKNTQTCISLNTRVNSRTRIQYSSQYSTSIEYVDRPYFSCEVLHTVDTGTNVEVPDTTDTREGRKYHIQEHFHG